MKELLLNLELMGFEDIQNCPFIKYPENLPSPPILFLSKGNSFLKLLYTEKYKSLH